MTDKLLLEKFPEDVILVPESHFNRLMGICAKKNGCKGIDDPNCQCANINFVPKKRGRPTKERSE